MNPNLESSQAQPVKEIKEDCAECAGTGKKYFNDLDSLVTYMDAKYLLFNDYEILGTIRQYLAEGEIYCPICSGRGYRIERR